MQVEVNIIPRPWYKHPLVWMLIAIPAAAVVAGFITLWLAITTSDGLVVDDYYKQGLAINKSLKRDIEASSDHLSAELSVLVEQRLVNLDLNKGQLADYPDSLELLLRHATRGDSDATIELAHGQGSQYIGYLKSPLPAGAWYIELGNADWRLNARVRLENLSSVKLESDDAAVN